MEPGAGKGGGIRPAKGAPPRAYPREAEQIGLVGVATAAATAIALRQDGRRAVCENEATSAIKHAHGPAAVEAVRERLA